VKFWLMKSEPEEFGIEDLKRVRTEPWDGVRNYQARNMMRDEMKKGDKVFFYHSNCDEPGVYGVMRIKREAYPDHTAFDPDDKHYDPKSDPDNPRWFMVDVGYVRKFKQPVTLRTMREYTETELRGLALLRRGNRLSIMPVTPAQWEFILGLAK
jgi:predicted RNA-binding protein with PUA-like domain